MKVSSARSFFNSNFWFLVPYALLMVILGIIHLLYSKHDIHLFINSANSPSSDIFFKYLTTLGHGLFTLILIFLFLFISFRNSVVIFLSFVFSGIIVQSLKTTIFSETLRPMGYFQGKETLHFVDGVNQLVIQTFPSGHSASAFALFLCLAAFTKNKLVKFLLFVIAALVAYSRVYLSQHFMLDAMAGSLIGVLVSLIILYFLYYRKPFGFLDNSILPTQK